MKRYITTAAICLIAYHCLADDNIWLANYDGKLKVLAPRAKILATQSWDGDLSKIPFNLKHVADSALAHLQRKHPEMDKFEIGSVSFHRFSHPEALADKWYFEFLYTGVKDSKNMNGFFIWVLSDGTVVEPAVKM